MLIRKQKIFLFLLIFILLILITCDDFSLYSLWDNESSVSPLAINPKEIEIGYGEQCEFSATGGVPPYTFSISPVLPMSGILNQATGLYTAPYNNVNEHILLTDSEGSTDTALVKVRNL
jgi:hypothetical protein